MKKYLLSILLVFALVTSMWSAVALEYSDIRGHWAEGSILESNFTGSSLKMKIFHLISTLPAWSFAACCTPHLA